MESDIIFGCDYTVLGLPVEATGWFCFSLLQGLPAQRGSWTRSLMTTAGGSLAEHREARQSGQPVLSLSAGQHLEDLLFEHLSLAVITLSTPGASSAEL